MEPKYTGLQSISQNLHQQNLFSAKKEKKKNNNSRRFSKVKWLQAAYTVTEHYGYS